MLDDRCDAEDIVEAGVSPGLIDQAVLAVGSDRLRASDGAAARRR